MKIIKLVLILVIGSAILSAQETFVGDSETYELLKALSKSTLAHGNVLLFTTTHQDIAWLNEPEICKIDRDRLWLTPYLNRLNNEPDFKIDIEQSSIVMEYLHRHPEKKENFIKHVNDGRITIGGTYVQAYEEMYSGESLARQFYLGKKWLRDNLNGYESNVYFNNDVPGRTLQMPQLASKSGVNNFVFARHIKGLFYWESPDGSRVVCYSPGNHYMGFYNLLGQKDSDAIKTMATDAIDWYSLYNNKSSENSVMPAMLNFEFIWPQEPIENTIPFMNLWNGIKFVETKGKKQIKVDLPKFKYATAEEFFNGVSETTSIEKTIKGERPNIWVYIHGAGHQKALKASRQGDILITQAEKFATANALIHGSFNGYPTQELQNAWESKIYPDHGWGGKGGDVTDNVFLQKFLSAKASAEKILDESITSIARNIKFNQNKEIPIVVFNSLSWKRSGPVNFKINFSPNEFKNLQLVTEDGQIVPIQLSKTKHYTNGFLESAEVNFIAENLPSIGYRTFYLESIDHANPNPTTITSTIHNIENAFYKIRVANGGLESIYDKTLSKELITPNQFKAGEVFALNSYGNGAGEFSAIQQPDTSFFDKLGNGKTTWKIDEEGEVFTSFSMRQRMKEAVVEMKITLFNTIKRIDFEIDLLNWDGVMFREFRMALPLNMENGEVTYEVPFGAVTVGKDELKGTGGELYNMKVSEIHPRAMENWVSASNSEYGITMSSSVITFDWKNPADSLSNQIILQPILLASRRSCHPEGNDYHQTGDHQFSFSLTSHPSGWKNGQRFGKQSNEYLNVVVNPSSNSKASLPEQLSFFKTDKENLIISAVKKAEDDQSTIIRLYDTDSKNVNASVSIFSPIKTAQLTNLIEIPIRKLKVNNQNVQLQIGHNAIETIKIK
ncbi:MAG: glycosyl hydrolase-related protein [Flavobacteriaceae bacterium]|nr:glycosyl hydrolase-related protein [Flavobacteriaceae bacterium]